uniref:Uncharacterized protein n=1 Tax=Cacopsylla melanoneura TaxID=428564 RepID=A0A8D9AV03_9HEMI
MAMAVHLPPTSLSTHQHSHPTVVAAMGSDQTLLSTPLQLSTPSLTTPSLSVLPVTYASPSNSPVLTTSTEPLTVLVTISSTVTGEHPRPSTVVSCRPSTLTASRLFQLPWPVLNCPAPV